MKRLGDLEHWWSDVSRRVELPGLLVVGTLLLTYGYEVFNFNLSVDEDIAGVEPTRLWADTLIGQGRWAMGVVTLLFPNAIGPVVTVALGVALTALAYWALCRGVLRLDRWTSALAVSIAVSMPVIAIGFTFSLIAIGIGIGQALMVVVALNLRIGHPRNWMTATLASTVAIGIYDPFFVATVMITLLVTLMTGLRRVLFSGIAACFAGYLLSHALGILAQTLARTPASHYTNKFFDFGSFFEQFPQQARRVLGESLGPLVVTRSSTGMAAPWVWILLVTLVLLAVVGLFRRRSGSRFLLTRSGSLLGLFLVPLLVVSATIDIPLRTMFYLPLIWIGLITAWQLPALEGSKEIRKTALASRIRLTVAVLGALAVISQAIVSNRIYAAGEPVLAHDRYLAFQIEQARERLADDSATPLVIASRNFVWPDSPLSPRRDNVGVSLFSGEPAGATNFLSSQGVGVVVPRHQQDRYGRQLLADMPIYPKKGWISYQDGLLLVRLTRSLK